MPDVQTRSATPAALIEAGIRLFGERGYSSASTRALAEAAGANVAAIAYHFGSKEGLRAACGRAAAARLTHDVAGPALTCLEAALAARPSREAARAALLQLVDLIVPAMVARPELDPVVRFVLREQGDASPAFAIVHDAFIAPMHERLCRLWARAAGGDPESAEVKLVTLTVLAQILYFRIARNVALKRLGWRDIGEREALAIACVIRRNVEAALADPNKEP